MSVQEVHLQSRISSLMVVIKHASKAAPPPPPVSEDADFGVNIIKNTSLNDDTTHWIPLGNCTMSVHETKGA
ncbi:hypothetical protein HAX54_013386 [Datura stramonium]|uniref:Uncharacterized protein n=1 Tax=Datura stramonium TaxID=4076 RepID=A0ABS8Y1R1_DATST|nr:hypothetical protein [Datura stramonium]